MSIDINFFRVKRIEMRPIRTITCEGRSNPFHVRDIYITDDRGVAFDVQIFTDDGEPAENLMTDAEKLEQSQRDEQARQAEEEAKKTAEIIEAITGEPAPPTDLPI